MSQYPSPYVPPQGPIDFDRYIPANNDLLAPGRRAGVMLWVVAGLMVLMGFCIATVYWIIPIDQILAQSGAKLPEMPPGFPVETMVHLAATVIGVGAVITGLLLAILAVFVRRGSRGAAITAVVLCSLILLYCVVNTISLLVIGNPGFIVMALVTALFVTQILWLRRAIRAASEVDRVRRQYQAAYWHAQQQQQLPSPAGYGYGTPPTHPSPPQ